MTNTVTQESIAEWISKNDLMNKKSFATANNSTSAGIRANFIGKDTSNPEAGGREIFSNPENTPVAVTSILGLVHSKTGFWPENLSPKEAADKFFSYGDEVIKIPFFTYIRNDHFNVNIQSSNYDDVINTFVGAYGNTISQEEKNKMKDSITALAKGEFASNVGDSWQNLFSQLTIIYRNPNDVRFLMCFANLRMHKQNNKPAIDVTQVCQVNLSEFKINTNMVRQYAEQLSRLSKFDVNTWATMSSTPQKKNYALCWDQKPYYETGLVK